MINWINTEMYDKSLNDNKRCIIVIPIYKETLLQTEQLSLKQCVECLGNKYEICLVCSNGLDVTNYKNIVENYHFNYLPCNPEFFNSQSSYSMLCETRQFYECFAKYEYMLIYQLDGWVFVNNDLKKFLDMGYDYIGSPWPAGTFGRNKESVGNGGVSLRKISKFIEICSAINKFDLNSKYAYLEDMFFCNYIPAIKKHIQFNIASVRDAAEFCITAEPSHFVEMNGGKLPMFAHGWNKEYEYDNFWKDCIPVNNFVYKEKSLDYYDIYSNKLINDTTNKKQPVDIFTQWLQSNNQDGIIEKNIKAKKLAEAKKREEENAKKEEERKKQEAKQEEVKKVEIKQEINVVNKDFIIVTMTSWKKRIGNLPHIIECIMNNTMLPNKICINLAVEEFPNLENDLPINLIKIIEKYEIVEINWVQHNTKVWKKLIPTLVRYPEAVVISIDDDWEYPNNIIKTLYDEYCKYDKKYPISGNREKFHKMQCHCGSGSLTSYKLLNNKNQFDSLTEECMNYGSDDIFYSYCALVNGNEYKISPTLFFTNMKPYQQENGFSSSKESNVDIAKTYQIAKQNYENNVKSDRIDYVVETFKNDKILICIFNYKHDDNAKKWLHMLQPYFETVVLDSGNDHEEKEFIQFPNIYYSGLFNEMKKLSEKKQYEWIGMIPSDIYLISDLCVLINKIKWLTTTQNIGLWQPSLDSTSRKFGNNIHNNKKMYEFKKVLEAHFLFINNEILQKFDYIDLIANKLGYGVSEILSGLSTLLNYGNLFDNSIQIHHSNKAEYDTNEAEKESKSWTPSQCKKYNLNLETLLDIADNNNNNVDFAISLKNDPKIIVSITSWAKRIKYVSKAIESIKKQTMKPDKIILTLSLDELSIKDVPIELLNDNDITISWVKENVKSWKKFLPIEKYYNDYVIVCDDDFYYHSTYIEELYNCAFQHDSYGAVCYSCNYCNNKGEPWGNVRGQKSNGKYWIAGGVTMWCPFSFPLEAFYRYNDIMSKYELQCDECYLMPFIYYYNIPIYVIEENWKTFYKKTTMIDDSQDIALHKMFFTNGWDLKTNKKNRLLQEVVSQLEKPYRDNFKQIFNEFAPIADLYPENKK